MANKIIKDAKDVKNASIKFDKNVVQLEANGETFIHGAQGFVSGKETKLQKEALTKAIEEGAKGVKGSKLKPEQYEALVAFARDNSSRFVGANHPLQAVIDSEAYYNAYKGVSPKKPATLDALGKLLVEEKTENAHLAHVPEETVAGYRRAMNEHGENVLEEFKGGVKKIRGLGEKIMSTDFSVEKFDKPGAIQDFIHGHFAAHDEKSLQAMVGRFPKAVDEKIASITAHGSMDEAIKGFQTKVAESKTFQTDAAKDIKRLKGLIQKQTGYFGDPKKLADLQEELGTAEKRLSEHLAEDVAHGVANKALPDGVRAQLNESKPIQAAASKATSGISSAASDVVKKDGSWFTHNAEELAKIAEKQGKDVEKLGKWARRTTGGKAAIIGGIAAVGAVILAAVGNKGPGEKAQSVSSGRDQQAGLGVA